MRKFPSIEKLRAVVTWCVLVALTQGPAAGSASELRSTKDFADVATAVEKAAEKYGPQSVLLALDIDNTVMSMDNDLGSDHWFEWQRYLLENEPDSPLLVAKTFDELLKVQGILYDQGRMHPPELEQPGMIARLQKLGIATILLTSRGPEFRAVTERELVRCGYDFAATALPVSNVPNGTFLAYDPLNPEKAGLSAAELATYKLGEPRPVSYVDGVFMTAGQHKGIMLLTLLKRSQRPIKAVIYLDDNVKHVGNVFSAAEARGLDVSTFHYQREDTRVQRFNYSDKRDVDLRWRAIKQAAEAFPASVGPEVITYSPPSYAEHRRCVRRIRCCR